MQTPEALKSQINSTQDMQSVVKTMKALAAVNIQQYQSAIESLRRYSFTLELGFQILLNHTRFGADLGKSQRVQAGQRLGGQLGLILFGSDQGLCGQFNQQIVQYLSDYLNDPPGELEGDRHLATVGSRPVPNLENNGLTPQAVLSVPNSVSEITGTVQDLLLLIEQWRETYPISRILLFHNRPTSGLAYESIHAQLLPLDWDWLDTLRQRPWEARGLPMVLVDEDRLFSRLVQQYLFIRLYRAMAASLASENASRLAAMQSAESNIDERLDELTADYRRQRQSAITAELLDVVSGFEALTGQE